MVIYNVSRQSQIADQALLADNPFSRMKGLLGRKHFQVGQALIIKPCQSVHMMFMAFAIDVIFLNKEHKVIGLCNNLKPFALSPLFSKSSCAIELPAGTIISTNTQLGDLIHMGDKLQDTSHK